MKKIDVVTGKVYVAPVLKQTKSRKKKQTPDTEPKKSEKALLPAGLSQPLTQEILSFADAVGHPQNSHPSQQTPTSTRSTTTSKKRLPPSTSQHVDPAKTLVVAKPADPIRLQNTMNLQTNLNERDRSIVPLIATARVVSNGNLFVEAKTTEGLDELRNKIAPLTSDLFGEAASLCLMDDSKTRPKHVIIRNVPAHYDADTILEEARVEYSSASSQILASPTLAVTPKHSFTQMTRCCIALGRTQLSSAQQSRKTCELQPNGLSMRFNATKTVAMYISRTTATPPPITFAGATLEYSHEHRHLGFILDSALSFHAHVNALTRKGATEVFLLRRLSYKVKDRDLLLKIYKMYVRPHLEYASPAWAALTITQTGLLESL
ncbi:hypothetical protein CAPTEDRAFT_185040 [Capitella teleta]|uniref:Alkylated DNA repair protein AlkB homologue 8 N-terminal domain-containing protein n=1 Tax=Capitella teleta TaxID=283909 RepID=R7T6X2_CAPTE|nr:hypothetical protein CAPTEDRAFT_185040 [Capitella teleta]|eukprot:ELT89280.1 hypothetical protein CAPTEDRAFT_185040 [Capitella teleta]